MQKVRGRNAPVQGQPATYLTLVSRRSFGVVCRSPHIKTAAYLLSGIKQACMTTPLEAMSTVGSTCILTAPYTFSLAPSQFARATECDLVLQVLCTAPESPIIFQANAKGPLPQEKTTTKYPNCKAIYRKLASAAGRHLPTAAPGEAATACQMKCTQSLSLERGYLACKRGPSLIHPPRKFPGVCSLSDM